MTDAQFNGLLVFMFVCFSGGLVLFNWQTEKIVVLLEKILGEKE